MEDKQGIDKIVYDDSTYDKKLKTSILSYKIKHKVRSNKNADVDNQKFKIILGPHKLLSTVCEELDLGNSPRTAIKKIHTILKDMFMIMKRSRGIGLAAPQVGINKRFFIMHINDKSPPMVFINPKIIKKNTTGDWYPEGCLSFPNRFVRLLRSWDIVVEYYDINANLVHGVFKNLDAICIQHEIDHLDGVTILDHNAYELSQNEIDAM